MDRDADLAAEQEGAGRHPAPACCPSILVVDDDPTFCAIVAEILRGYQAQVYTAGSVTEAMAVLEQTTPDLILTDVMMPDIDGLTLVRQIRSGGPLARVRIIIVSARVANLDRVAAFQAGADQFLAKPFSLLDLRAAVGQLLPL
jgi:CheY-like chemotaxis protein